MNKNQRIFLVFFLLICVQGLVAQPSKSIKGTENTFRTVPPPAIYTERAVLNTAAISTWIVERATNVPDSIYLGVQRAAAIWSYLVGSSQPIRVRIGWRTLGKDELAVSMPTQYFRKFPGCPDTSVFYPVTLAEALCSSQLNAPADPDIQIDFCDTVAWNCSLLGLPVYKKCYIVEVAMHEMGHGLGFAGSFFIDPQTQAATFGFLDSLLGVRFPSVFDVACAIGPSHQNASRLRYSSVLATDLQSGNIFFDPSSDHAYGLNGSRSVKLFAPNPFIPGSSISHLDSAEFSLTGANPLMCPAIPPGEAIQSPGEVGLAVFNDLGWQVARLTTVISPMAGVALQPGQVVTVRWTDNQGGALTLDLLRVFSDGTTQPAGTITSRPSGPAGPDSTMWQISSSLADGDYRIRMWYPGTGQGYGLSGTFQITRLQQVATPSFDPPGGWYPTGRQVTISCNTTGAAIYYTLDGTAPDSSKTRYTGGTQISVNGPVLLQAIAYKGGMTPSAVAQATYSIGNIPAPTIGPSTSQFVHSVRVRISWPSGVHCAITWGTLGRPADDPKGPNSTEIFDNPYYMTFYADAAPIAVRAVCYTLSGSPPMAQYGVTVAATFNAMPEMRIAQVDSAGAAFGQWSSWEGDHWQPHPDTIVARPSSPTTMSVLAERGFKPNTTQKFRVWNTVLPVDYRNFGEVPVTQATDKLLGQFAHVSFPTVQSTLEGTPASGLLEVLDPWLPDDSSSVPRGPRNRSMSAQFHTVAVPFSFNIPSFGYRGAFLSENPAFDRTLPIYQLRAPLTQVFSGKSGSFIGWDTSAASLRPTPNPAPPGFDQRSAVFTAGNAWVAARYKGVHLSSAASAFYSSSHKFAQTSDGFQHLVYESMGHVYYECKAPGGSWQLVIGGPGPRLSLDVTGGKSPALDVSVPDGATGPAVAIVLQEGTTIGLYRAIPSPDQSSYIIDFRWDIASDATNPNAVLAPNLAWGRSGLLMINWLGSQLPGVHFACGFLSSFGTFDGCRQSLGRIEGTMTSGISDIAVSTDKSTLGAFDVTWKHLVPPVPPRTSPSDTIRICRLQFSYVMGQCGTVSQDAFDVVSGGSYIHNSSPTLVSVPGAAWVGWILDRSGIMDPMQMSVQLRNAWATPYYRQYDYAPKATTLNRLDASTDFALAWSRYVSNTWTNYYVKSTNFAQMRGLQTSGQALQLCNAPSFSSMTATVFYTGSAPYNFQTSNNLAALGKSDGAKSVAFSGRGVMVDAGDLHFQCALRGIKADGIPISFAPVPASLNLRKLDHINQVLMSEPFSANSRLEFTDESTFDDSLGAQIALGALKGEIRYRLELVDASTGASIAQMKSGQIGSTSIAKSTRGSYVVAGGRFPNKNARLKLTLTATAPAIQTALVDIYSIDGEPDGTVKKPLVLENALPSEFSLDGAFPNPFNPTTQIRFALPEAVHVSLVVYDILGRTVAGLLDGRLEAGYHTVAWNASNTASGVYFARLVAADGAGNTRFSRTVKLSLTK